VKRSLAELVDPDGALVLKAEDQVSLAYAGLGAAPALLYRAPVAYPLAAAVLILSLGGRWSGEFDVELAIAEGVAGVELAGLGDDFEVAVFYFPFGGSAVFVLPSGEIFAVEQDDGVGGRAAGSVLRARAAGVDYGGHGSIGVVNLPFGIDLGLRESGCGEDEKCEAR
jgi:hypothetical protein